MTSASSPLIDACRAIVNSPLDDGATRAAITAYFSEAGVKDYEASWKSRLDKFLSIIETGETSLCRVIGKYNAWLEKKRGTAPSPYVTLGRVVDIPTPACLYLQKAALNKAVLQACSRTVGPQGKGPTTDLVMELGSGWADHLLNVWLNGGPPAQYVACEITESGRKCTEILAKLEPLLRLQTAHFNYAAPDFSFLSGRKFRKAVVFSSQSIEQVERVHEEMIPKLLAVADEVVGIHFEPIGWQFHGKDDDTAVVSAHEARCREMKYNTNYWELLQRLQAEKKIEIETSTPYYIGLAHNPVCFIKWRSVGSC